MHKCNRHQHLHWFCQPATSIPVHENDQTSSQCFSVQIALETTETVTHRTEDLPKLSDTGTIHHLAVGINKLLLRTLLVQLMHILYTSQNDTLLLMCHKTISIFTYY